MNAMTEKKTSDPILWRAFGGIMLAVVAIGLLANVKDIKRYIKISTM
jgi:hypothetical protein